jgi:hypothetical protein
VCTTVLAAAGLVAVMVCAVPLILLIDDPYASAPA